MKMAIALTTTAFAASLGACGEDPVSATFLVYGPDGANTFPVDVQGQVDEIVVTAYRGDDRVDSTTVRNFAGPGTVNVTLPAVPHGKNVWISVEAFDAANNPIASGATPRFDSKSGVNYPVFTVRPNRFQRAFGLFADEQGQLVSSVSNFENDLPGEGRAGHSVTQLEDGRIVVIGGANMTSTAGGLNGSAIPSGGLNGTIEIYDPRNGLWNTAKQDGCGASGPGCFLALPNARAFHTATLTEDGDIMVAGGLIERDGALIATETTEIIRLGDRFDGTIEPGPNLNDSRAFHSATRMSDGRILFAGGLTDRASSQVFLNTLEFWFPGEASMRSSTFLLDNERGQHTAANIDIGQHGVALIGGRNTSGVVADTEIIFLQAGASGLELGHETRAPLAEPRFGHAMARTRCPGYLNPAGEQVPFLVVAGGYTAVGANVFSGSSPTASVEVYDIGNGDQIAPAFNATRVAAGVALSAPRAFLSGVGLEVSGDLVFAGGLDASGTPVGTADRLLLAWASNNPACTITRRNDAGGLSQPRAFAGATFMTNQFGLFVGGWGGSSSSPGADFYNSDDYSVVDLVTF